MSFCVIELRLFQHYNDIKRGRGVEIIMEKLIITPKEDKAVTMTIRIDRTLQEKYNQLASQTNRSRNELINIALKFALEHLEIKEDRK